MSKLFIFNTPKAGFIVHPSEIRLTSQLPHIIQKARQQISTAMIALDRSELATETLRILEELLGQSDAETARKIKHKLSKLDKYINRLTPQHFDIAEELYEAGDHVVGYARITDTEDFKRGVEKKYISLSYLETGRMHTDDIASTVIHEMSHLVLKTDDFAYSINMSKQAPGLFTPYSVKNLYDYARKSGSLPLDNAETLARIVTLIYFSLSTSPTHQNAYALYWKSGPDRILAYHRMDAGTSPRITSPEIMRKTNTLRKIGNHFVI